MTALSSSANPLTPERARELAVKVYEDRRDKRGYEEFSHAEAVANGVPKWAQAVAWMHDTVEDGLLSFKQMYREMSREQFEALLLLTREKGMGQTYMQYIGEIALAPGTAGEIARAVKLADLKHNMSRPCPPEMTGMREEGGRYHRALAILEGSEKVESRSTVDVVRKMDTIPSE